MRLIALLAFLALASACSQKPDRRALLTPLIGASEVDLVTRMGVPNRTYEAGGVKFLGYVDRSVDVVPGFYPVWRPGYYPYGGFPPEVIENRCETTFEVVNGRVRSFNFRGNAC